MGNIQKTLALIVGYVLVLVGLIGFFNNPVLGLFSVNSLHSIIHLLTGGLFLVGAYGGWAKSANKWFGLVYLLVAVLGIFGALSFLAVRPGFGDLDNLLHLVLGLVIAGIGFFAE